MSLPKFGHLYRLTRSPDLLYSQSGLAICKVGLACSEKYNDKETQLFIDATAFKGTAEALAKADKGHRVFVTGKIQTESWQDQNSGQKRSKTTMIIESFEYIEKREPQQQGNNQNQGFNQQQTQNNGYQQQQYQQHGGGQGGPPDELPFRHNEV